MREERTRLRLTHEVRDGNSRHIFRNFGEDLWARTRDDNRWTVDIEEVDRADDSFDLLVRRSVLKGSIRFVEDLLSKHLLREKVRIEIIVE